MRQVPVAISQEVPSDCLAKRDEIKKRLHLGSSSSLQTVVKIVDVVAETVVAAKPVVYETVVAARPVVYERPVVSETVVAEMPVVYERPVVSETVVAERPGVYDWPVVSETVVADRPVSLQTVEVEDCAAYIAAASCQLCGKYFTCRCYNTSWWRIGTPGHALAESGTVDEE